MKSCLKIFGTVVGSAVLGLSLFGCGGSGSTEGGTEGEGESFYSIYTNIPQSEISDLSSSYQYVGGLEGGFALTNGTTASDYTSKQNTFYSMNTQGILTITAPFTENGVEDEYNNLCSDVESLLDGVERSISTTIKSSYVTAFNNAPAGETVEIDQTTYEVLSLAINMYNLTGGYYNPAVYYSVIAYGFSGASVPATAEDLPSDEVISSYVTLSQSFAEIVLLEFNGDYYAIKPSTTVEIGGVTYSLKIDLGGIGKGYSVDKINQLIDSHGFSFGNFSFGSSSIVVKNQYKSGNYTIGLTNPRGDSERYMKTKANNACISTSGDYEQYYTIDGVRYCHIIDPTTGKPVQTGIMSATIIGGSAAEDDALTTAIMAMGKDKAIEFVNEKLSDRRVVFTYDGR